MKWQCNKLCVKRGMIMGQVSDVFDIADNCAEFYNLFFVDCKMERISQEMDYLNKISDNPGQIRNYFLSLSGQMYMPLKIRYIRDVLACSDKELREGLSNRYQILDISRSQIMQNKIDTRPIKFVSNVYKAVEDARR